MLTSTVVSIVFAVICLSLVPASTPANIVSSNHTDLYCDEYYEMYNHKNRYSNLPYVKKTHRNDSMATFIFVAGLGGTGHHLFAQTMDYVHRAHKKKNHYDAKKIRVHLWNTGQMYGLFTFAENKFELCTSMKYVVRGYKHYINITSSQSYYMINCLHDILPTGLLSYPNMYTDDLPYEPNLNVLASLAEKSDADLRVLVLLRHPVNSMISILKSYFGTDRKTIHGIEHYVDVFTTSQRYLLAQLEATDPGIHIFIIYLYILIVNDCILT